MQTATHPQTDAPRPYLIARLFAGQAAPTYYRANLRHHSPDEYGWTTDPAQATRIHGTRAELRQAFGPDVIAIPQ